MESPDINLLIKQSQLGCSASWDRLIQCIQQRISPYILKMLNGGSACDDVMQETLLSVYRKLGTLKQIERFWPWVFRITRNKIKDYYRLCQRLRTSPFSVWETDDKFLHLPDEQSDTLMQMIASETRLHFNLAVRNLQENYREIIQKRNYEQKSYKHIAFEMACSPQSARSCYHRAKHQLRNDLAYIVA